MSALGYASQKTYKMLEVISYGNFARLLLESGSICYRFYYLIRCVPHLDNSVSVPGDWLR